MALEEQSQLVVIETPAHEGGEASHTHLVLEEPEESWLKDLGFQLPMAIVFVKGPCEKHFKDRCKDQVVWQVNA